MLQSSDPSTAPSSSLYGRRSSGIQLAGLDTSPLNLLQAQPEYSRI